MKRLPVLLCLLLVQAALMAQSIKISGRVTDGKTGQALAGASVMVKATGAGTYTDDEGNFSLALSKAGKVTLVFSYVGYADAEKTADAGANLTIGLTATTGKGDEVVVSASKRPEKITRAPATISVITSRDLA